MYEPQPLRMQCLPVETQRFQYRFETFSLSTVNRVSDQGVSQMRHMDADLMRPPGFQPAFHHGRAAQPFHCPVMRHGMFAPPFPMNRHLLSIGVGSADPTVDRAGRRLRHAIDDGGIEPVDRMRLELLRQPFMRAVGLCDDQQARRSEEHTSELQSLMRISYAVFCLKKKKQSLTNENTQRLYIQRN